MKQPVYDILNCGPNARFVANGRIVHNSGGINLQNVPRGSKLKEAIKAPEGHVIVGVDLSNIELRVGLWFAGQLDKLALLAQGVDLYKDFASSVFGVPYAEVTKEQRFIGKTSQLSLIYGVGANKLRQAIKTGSGVDIGEDEAKRIVALYRQEYAHVAMAWRLGEQVLRAIASGESMGYGTRGVIQVSPKGCRLPSGMFMHYPGLERVMGDDGKANWVYYTRKGKEKLYGAKMFQGLTQALARCVMGDGMLLTAKRYPIALTVHDAEYFVAPEAEGPEALQFAIDSVCTPPKWAPELPLAAEGAFGKTLADC
jgi:DNA polymerase bacteriophage-type